MVVDEEDRYVIERPSDISLLDELQTVPTDEINGLPDKANIQVWIWTEKIEEAFEDVEQEEYIEQELWTNVELPAVVFPVFLQGFISMCTAFMVDFRDYFYSLPTDHDGVEYDIPMYHLKQYFANIPPGTEYEDE